MCLVTNNMFCVFMRHFLHCRMWNLTGCLLRDFTSVYIIKIWYCIMKSYTAATHHNLDNNSWIISLDQMLALKRAWNCSMSHETSSHEISKSLEIARLGVKMVISLWNFSDASAAVLPKRLINIKAITKFEPLKLCLRYFARSYAIMQRSASVLSHKASRKSLSRSLVPSSSKWRPYQFPDSS